MNEREIAVNIITEALKEGYGNFVLRKTLNRNKGLSRVKKAFITELVNGTFRNIIKIDYIIAKFSSIKINKMKPLVLNVLRISVYQLLYMTKVPVSAACNEAVEIVKRRGFKNLSGFVNGVLRNIARNIDKIKYPDREKEPVKYISVMYSFPEEIINYWLEACSMDYVIKMCEESNKTPKVSVAVNTLKTGDEELIEALREDIIGASLSGVKGVLNVSKTSDITESHAYRAGYFHVMDTSSYMCVNILDPQRGEKILDVCAAPGGKSFAAAYKMHNCGEITARDIYRHKIRLIEEGAARLGTDIVKAELGDAEKLSEGDIEKYDRVLVDAPCSGLGIVKKKPDIKYNKTVKDIEELVKVQRRILSVAQRYVKQGGILVYSTCTVSVKENEENARWFLDNFDFEPCDLSDVVPEGWQEAEKGFVNITPWMLGGDGFFVSKFKKTRKQ